MADVATLAMVAADMQRVYINVYTNSNFKKSLPQDPGRFIV